MVETKDIQRMIPVVKEKYPFMANSDLYKDLKLASKQFANDFKFGIG